MTDSTMPPAGWYPAAHADGELRYWDGVLWHESPAPGAEPTAETAQLPAATRRSSDAKPSFFRRPTTRRTAAIVGGAAFVLGVLIGVGGGAGDPATIAALKDQIEVLETERAETLELVADRDAVDTARDVAEDRVAELEGEAEAVQTELVTAEEELAAAQAELAAVQADRDAQQARVAELEAAAAPAPAPVVEQPSAPVNVSYENCAAARAAGAAPVYSSDPGYGRHLDRDGDGVGCE